MDKKPYKVKLPDGTFETKYRYTKDISSPPAPWFDNTSYRMTIMDMSKIEAPKIREFPTGAHRDTNVDKSRPDLITPYFLKRFGQHLANGASKYGEFNWQKGIDNKVYTESIFRHLLAIMEGDETEDHEAAIAFGCMGLMDNAHKAGMPWNHFKLVK